MIILSAIKIRPALAGNRPGNTARLISWFNRGGVCGNMFFSYISAEGQAMIDPIFTTTHFSRQSEAMSVRQPAPNVKSVNEAARPIVAGIIEPRGDTVGVLTYDRRAKEGGLEGAGMYTGTA